jgi:uncharacterized protein (DUF2249 family)
MNDGFVTVDVREDIRNGREPFSKIMSAVAALEADQALRLIAPFEPVPLFDVLTKKGFQHAAHQVGPAHWEVLFSRTDRSRVPPASDFLEQKAALPKISNQLVEQPAAGSVSSIEVDARGLEPPQPMVRILEALASLPEGAELRAHTDRRPIHLYPQLEQRGFTGKSEEQSDGSYITYICRR